ncbi:hypothetical protein J7643_17130 [bacterium]|nr:hypothetical protein [bacterium]
MNNNRKKSLAGLALLGALLGGCATSTMTSSTTGGASLQVTPEVASGQYRTQTLAPLTYTRDDIRHLVVKLYKVTPEGEQPAMNGANPIQLDLDADPRFGFSANLTFTNLHPWTDYRVRGYAYKAPGTAESDLISLDASSSIDITVENVDRVYAKRLKIQLIDRVFNGQATASTVTFTDGGLTHAGSASVSFE